MMVGDGPCICCVDVVVVVAVGLGLDVSRVNAICRSFCGMPVGAYMVVSVGVPVAAGVSGVSSEISPSSCSVSI